MTDLTQITTPFGLLDEETQQALRDWPHGLEVFCPSSEWRDAGCEHFFNDIAYRAKPAPERVVWYTSTDAKGFASRTFVPSVTFRISCNPDGTDPQIQRVEG